MRITIYYMLLIAFMSALAVSAFTCYMESPMGVFQTRIYSFIVDVEGWILKISIEFSEPWIAGAESRVTVTADSLEYSVGSVLTIFRVKATVGGSSVEGYLGVFTGIGEARSVTLSIPLTGEYYSRIKAGDSVLDILSLSVEGYVEFKGGRVLFHRNFAVPVLIVSLTGHLKVSLEAPGVVKAPSTVSLLVTIFNMGESRAYNIWVNIYVNSALIYARYYDILEPGKWKVLTWSYTALDPGVYRVEVKVSYVSSEYAEYESIAVKTIYVKREVTVAIVSDEVSTQAEIPELGVKALQALVEQGGSITVKGLINPPGVYDVILEASRDLSIWTPIATLKSDSKGVFTSTVKFNVTGSTLVRVRVPETEASFEALSNIIIVYVREKLKEKVETAPLKVTMTADKASVDVAETVKLQVKVEPPVNTRVTIWLKAPGSLEWARYAELTLKDGLASIPFTPLQEGSHILKAVAEPADSYLGGESSPLTVTVTKKTAQTTTPSGLQEALEGVEAHKILIMGLIVIAGAISGLSIIAFFKRRTASSA